MRLLGVICGVVAVTLGAGTSWADGSIKDGPAAVARGCGGQFAGYYVGGQVGYIDHDAKFHNELDGGYVSGDDNGATFGIFSGYNIQCGRLLYGIESDFNFADTDATWSISVPDVFDASLSSEMNWFGTIRGRLGLVHSDNILFYVTGGLAYAKLDYRFSDYDVEEDILSYQKDSDTKFGWTLGAGVELIRHSNWLFRAEALYVDLGSETIDYEFSGDCVVCEARVKYEDDFWVARVGLAYRFGAREEAVVPLK